MSEGVLCKGFYKKKTQKAQLRDDNDVLFGVTTLVWNDKLKPYGFCLHGCINGYSRRCMWLHVGTTNKDAAVVATLYLNTVNQLEGCPQLVRSDPGTENVVVAAMQGILRFCFMPIIRQQLLEFMEDWNDRRIRPHRGATVPGGRPNVLFFLPERTGGDNFLNHLSQHDRQQAQHYCKPPGNDVGNEPLNMYLEEMMANMQRRVPDTWQEAAQLYIDLVYIASDP
ncbi:Hypp3614 [Branchiostoma lanceolatum]|uniref:Hypp3614 protein n=1 Tax=Branchiostoma lanceolatum TaxID=7740 RepID=A0A8K0EY49_BRALA|nr:Hypp3614 [Branchiostoma lanceolatum]